MSRKAFKMTLKVKRDYLIRLQAIGSLSNYFVIL